MLANVNVCDLIDERNSVEVSNPTSSSSNSTEEARDFVNEQNGVMMPLVKSLQLALNEHLESCLRSCEKSKADALRAQEEELTAKLGSSENTIQELNEQIVAATERFDRLYGQFLARGETISVVRCQTTTPACRAVKMLGRYLNRWRLWVSEEKNARRTERIIQHFRNRALETAVFHKMLKEHTYNKNIRDREAYARNMNNITRQTLGEYERDLEIWKARALTAEAKATSEHALRLKMEEDVKRLLLKNMAAINIEALSVFQQHIFPEGDEELRAFFPPPAENATSAELKLAETTGTVLHNSQPIETLDETLLLTKVLELQQAQLKRDVDYSPLRRYDLEQQQQQENRQQEQHQHLHVRVGYDGRQLHSSSRHHQNAFALSLEGDDDTPRGSAPVPLAVNVRPGHQYQHQDGSGVIPVGSRKAWRGGGSVPTSAMTGAANRSRSHHA